MTKDLNCPLPYRKLEAKRGKQQAPEKTAGGLPTFISGKRTQTDNHFCPPRVGDMGAELRPMTQSTEQRKRAIQAVKEGFLQEEGFLEETATREKALPKKQICWAEGRGNLGVPCMGRGQAANCRSKDMACASRRSGRRDTSREGSGGGGRVWDCWGVLHPLLWAFEAAHLGGLVGHGSGAARTELL